MFHNLKEQEINIQLLYYIQSEIQDSEMVEKIIWNNSMTDQVYGFMQNDSKVQVLGLYGTLESVSQYLNMKTNCIINIDAEIVKWQNRGILCWSNYQEIIYISFIAPDSYFNQPKFQESPEITVYRFLKDLCHTIILLPSQSIMQNWKNTQCHFYQETDSIIEEFKIIKLEEAEITVKTISLGIVGLQQAQILRFTHGCGNIRSEILQKNQDIKLIEISDQWIEKLFLNLLKNHNFDVATSLNDVSYEIRNIILLVSQEYQQKIDQFILQFEQDSLKEIKPKIQHKLGFGNKIKQNIDLFEKLHPFIFVKFRLKLNLEQLEKIDIDQFKESIIQLKIKEFSKAKDDNIKDTKEIDDNIEDLKEIISQYNKAFQEFYKNKKDCNFKQLNLSYKEQIKKLLKQLNQQRDFFIDLQLYEFRYITQKDTNLESQTILDQIGPQKISLTGLISPQQNQNFPIQILYYFYPANNKQTFLIIREEIQNNKNQLQYLWIDASIQKSQKILSIIQDKSEKLLFHYEQSNTTLFIFNTLMGIMRIKYVIESKTARQERGIDTQVKFVDFCYLRQFECFILISNKQGLFKWEINTQNIQKLHLNSKFSDDQDKNIDYQKVISEGNGNYFIFANTKKCDIYNFNNQIVAQIKFINHGIVEINLKELYLFSTEQDWFLCILDQTKPISIQIENMSSQQKIVSKNEVREEIQLTNPYLDLVKGSVVKYGPTINLFEFETIQTQLYVQQDIYNKIHSYFTLVDFSETDQLKSQQDIYEIKGPYQQVSKLIFYLLSRTSIQLCTIERQLLIPLCNGLRITQRLENNIIRVLEKVEYIQFGIIEKLLSYQKSKLFIISIMGRQSSGKSYLLNRIFGTRFSVSSARCTDGIWLSISKINDMVFVLFDCEGLFSSRRTPDDEAMLLSFITSISDITILNQDLTFSRNLTELFLKLSKSLEQIRGEKLFKGKLMIAVRDVNQKEKEGASKELKKNISALKNDQQTGSFLYYLFNDEFQQIFMSHFDNKSFDKDINELRKKFVGEAINTNRWDSQQQLTRSMKIMLVQLEVKDHRSLEDHELDHTIEILQKKANNFWCTFKQEGIEEIIFINIQDSYNNILEIVQKQTKIHNSTVTNNEILIKSDYLIQELLNKRQIEVMNLIDKEINIQTTINNKDKFFRVKKEIQQFLERQSNQYKICLEKCSECFLYCIQRKNHVQRDQVQQMTIQQEHIMMLKKEIDENIEKIRNQDSLDICIEKLEKLNKEKSILNNQLQFKYLQNQINDEEIKLQKFFKDDNFNFESFSQQLIIYFKIDDPNFVPNYINIVHKFNSDLECSDKIIQQTSKNIKIYQDSVYQQQNKVKILKYDDMMLEKEKIDQNLNKLNSELIQVEQERQQLQSIANEILIKLREQEQKEIVIKFLGQNQIDTDELQQIQTKKKQLNDQIQIINNSINQETKLINQELSKPYGLDNYVEQKINQSEDEIENFEGELLKSTQKLKRLYKQVEEKKKEQNQSNMVFEKNEQEIQHLQKTIDDYNVKKSLAEDQSKKWQIIKELWQNQEQIYSSAQQIKQIQQQDSMSDHYTGNQNDTSNDHQSQEEKTFEGDFDQLKSQREICQKEEVLQTLDHQQSIQVLEQFIQQAINILFPNQKEQLQQLRRKVDSLDVSIHEMQQFQILKNIEQNKITNQQQIDILNEKIVKIKQEINCLEQSKLQYCENIQDIHSQIDIINKEIEVFNEKIKIQQQIQQEQIDVQNKINADINKCKEISQIYENLLSLYESKKKFQESEDEIHILQQQDQLEQKKFEILHQINQLTEQISLKRHILEKQQQYNDRSEELANFQQFLNKQHQCGRDDHFCDQICDGCKNPTIFCKEKAGHQDPKDGNTNHLCINPKHYCIQKCAVINCEKQCQNQYNHDDIIKHDCLQKHQCTEICNFCTNRCDLNINEIHDIHICSVKQCTKQCYFGVNFFNEDKRCLNTCFKSHSEPHDEHICNNQNHSCQFTCQKQGTCQISSYIEQVKQWKTIDGCTFEYKVHKQVAGKIQCQSKFDLHQINHHGQHTCTEKHICDQRCPECEAYCTLPFGHTEKHTPHLHRNKEQQIFTAVEGSQIKKLIIKEEGEQERQFSLGESCEPETCTRSCTRRSRAHFHLLECKGGALCSEKLLNKGKKVAKHQPNKYQGSDKIYDEVLCENFWDKLGWENPIEAKQRLEISLCNYYCSSCGEKDKKYCTKEAWHTDSSNYEDHLFICKEFHTNRIGVDVQFVIDTTGSMGSYIQMVKQTVIELMISAQPYFKDNPDLIKFSVVSYKDHKFPYKDQIDPQVVESIDFTTHDNAVNFINSLKSDGGDDYPEAMLDGLNDGVEKSWRKNTKKFQFLLADSPPHGVPKFHNEKDSYPKGCPCNLVEERVLSKIQSIGIELIVLKLNENLNQTINVFSKIMPNIVYLNQMTNEEFIKKIDQLVCKELQIREITLNIKQQG